ncbi:hypothetical protein DWZ75_08525 [Bacteroides stercoris]|nr:hypothetical protein DWZ75_08525 [Bacteroides stercoris]
MPKRMIPLSSRKRGRWSYLFFRGKITIYKFTPQVFTLTLVCFNPTNFAYSWKRKIPELL